MLKQTQGYAGAPILPIQTLERVYEARIYRYGQCAGGLPVTLIARII